MQEDLRQSNLVLIIGEIASDYTYSHEMYGENFYTFDIKTDRLSDAVDILPVTISDRLINEEKFMIGNKIEIMGQIRSYNNIVDGRNHLILTIFAKEINFDIDDEKNPNQIILNGFVCKPPVYRKTPFGREIADILLAVNRSYNKSDYIPCIVWGRNAKFAGGLKVSDNIKINGRMQSRNYQKKLEDGEVIERVAYEISVSKIEVIQNEKEDKDENLEDEIFENEMDEIV